MKPIEIKDLLLYEDDDFFLLNKPPFVSTLDERESYGKNSIIRLAKAYHAEAQVAHRLDKETSGIIAVAKHPAAYRHISMQFEKRIVAKVYHALVAGRVELKGVEVTVPLGITRNGNAKIDFKEGKPAQTVFYTLQIFKKHTLLECYPITGRLHQIRIHLSHIKHPIVADEQYGGKPIFLSEIKNKNFKMKKFEDEQPLMQRVALHAHSLSFNLMNEERITVEAPYPKDMAALIKQLEKHT